MKAGARPVDRSGRTSVDAPKISGINILLGRGSWIRTNDLQYPKLPRYQAALYPDDLGNDVDTRSEPDQQGSRWPVFTGY